MKVDGQEPGTASLNLADFASKAEEKEFEFNIPLISGGAAETHPSLYRASDLATEVQKMKTHLVLREEAMKKSRQILFTGLCQYMGLDSEEVKKTWKRMREEDKWVLAKGFVLGWGDNFHPLSARSVKEMVEQHLVEENPSLSSLASEFFPNLKKIIGF